MEKTENQTKLKMDKTENWTKLKIEQNRTKLEELFGAILKVQN